MAMGPDVAQLSVEELGRFLALEAKFDSELQKRARMRVPSLGFGIPMPEDMRRASDGLLRDSTAARLRAAVQEVYWQWKEVKFDDDQNIIWFYRENFIP